MCYLNPSAKVFKSLIVQSKLSELPRSIDIVLTSCLDPNVSPFRPKEITPSYIPVDENVLGKHILSADLNFESATCPANNRNFIISREMGDGDDIDLQLRDENANRTQDFEKSETIPLNIDHDPECILKNYRIKHFNKIIIAHININSIRNKIDMLADLISGRIDILFISETKIDSTFPTPQFFIFGFSPPYRLDRSQHGGGLLCYVRSDIPSKLMPSLNNREIECVSIEIKIFKTKWLIMGTYNPCKSLIKRHLLALSNNVDHYSRHYDNFIILGDFNSETSEDNMENFCSLYNLKNLIKEPTCFKNVNNPSCIDLILTNRSHSFQDTRVVETGLSDFHKLTATVLKTRFKKQPPKIISYRSYKDFSHVNFRNDILNSLPHNYIDGISNNGFTNIVMNVLNTHAPLKSKHLRANESPFMTKELRKAIMLRSKLKNKLNRDKMPQSNVDYKKQRNLCTTLLRKCKKQFYANLNPAIIADNKTFWRIVKPFFSEKAISTENITLLENQDICDEDKMVAEIFNNFFNSVVKNLDIENHNKFINDDDDNETDEIIKAIKKYQYHPSILKIKETMGEQQLFSFGHTDFESINREILSLDKSKACPKDSIPPKIILENCDVFACKLEYDFNFSIDSGIFPDNLKNADISPVFKKGDRLDKTNYRPVSILPSISKIFERLLYYQLDTYIEPRLSTHQCGFRKNLSPQNCLLVMLEKFRKCRDHNGSTGVLLTDLSKAFDCLIHDLLIAKLDAYGLSYHALKLIYSYLSSRRQRVRVNSNYSSWSEIIFGVPQGSILGPLLFNIYLCDLFMFFTDSNIANYADDNSPFACSTDTDLVMSKLETDSKDLLVWVSNNGLKANPDKFHLILNTSESNHFIEIENNKIFNSNCEKLLGVKIDNNLSFDEHVTGLCNKASQKLHALVRIAPFMKQEQRKAIMKSFINSQFGYCPLVWMFYSRKLNNRINKIHERSLRVVYDDSISTFEELLYKDNAFTIHERNIQTLAIELFKVINGISPELMSQVFPIKSSTKYQSKNVFITRNVHTVRYGTETLAHLGPKIWNLVPSSLKEIKSLKLFKYKIKQWKPDKCPCRLCKVYIDGVGFIT